MLFALLEIEHLPGGGQKFIGGVLRIEARIPVFERALESLELLTDLRDFIVGLRGEDGRRKAFDRALQGAELAEHTLHLRLGDRPLLVLACCFKLRPTGILPPPALELFPDLDDLLSQGIEAFRRHSVGCSCRSRLGYWTGKPSDALLL